VALGLTPTAFCPEIFCPENIQKNDNSIKFCLNPDFIQPFKMEKHAMRTQFSKIVLAAALGLAMALTFSCSSDKDDEYTGGSCDASDYGRVEIGGKVWMAKNWGCYAQGSKCYNNNPDNCNTYGRLYDWATAMNIDRSYNHKEWGGNDVKHQGICPSGWHIPSDDEWSELVNFVESNNGCSGCAGKYLKTSVWGGEDKHGFSALPGGHGDPSGYFGNVGDYGTWWRASEYSSYSADGMGMAYYYEDVYWTDYSKDFLFSVRCVKD